MRFLTAVAVLLVATINPILAQDQPCVSGLHMIVARASDEPPGTGIIGIVARMIKRQLPNSSIVAVRYPATLKKYFHSEEAGVVAMTKLVKDYIDKCPNSKVALLGYSQGAQVLGDVLCGTSEFGFHQTDPLDKKYSDQIVAAIQMGDPTFIEGLPYDRGTSTKNGTFDRRDTDACLPYAQRLRSYCDRNDLFCASGSSLAVHIGYTKAYGKQAADFVIDRYRNPSPLSGSSGSNSPMGSDGSRVSASESVLQGFLIAASASIWLM